jgi:hypothetical protein
MWMTGPKQPMAFKIAAFFFNSIRYPCTLPCTFYFFHMVFSFRHCGWCYNKASWLLLFWPGVLAWSLWLDEKTLVWMTALRFGFGVAFSCECECEWGFFLKDEMIA